MSDTYVYPIGNGEFRTGHRSENKKNDKKEEGKLLSSRNKDAEKQDSVWSKPKYDESLFANYIDSLLGKTKDKEIFPETSFEKEMYNMSKYSPSLDLWDNYNKKVDEVEIRYNDIKDKGNISEKTAVLIKKLAAISGNENPMVTSTIRTPEKQARAMYDNLEKYGIDNQRALYGSYGDRVIDVYEQNADRPEQEVIELMTAKINELGPSNVSRHCRIDNSDLNVFDIAYSSLSNKERFIDAIEKYKNELGVLQVFYEKNCIHLEIIQ